MVSSKHILSINAAVMNCLARCLDSALPYVSLGDFLEKLRSMGWNEADVQAVQDAVLPMLGGPKTLETVGMGCDRVGDAQSGMPVAGAADCQVG